MEPLLIHNFIFIPPIRFMPGTNIYRYCADYIISHPLPDCTRVGVKKTLSSSPTMKSSSAKATSPECDVELHTPPASVEGYPEFQAAVTPPAAHEHLTFSISEPSQDLVETARPGAIAMAGPAVGFSYVMDVSQDEQVFAEGFVVEEGPVSEINHPQPLLLLPRSITLLPDSAVVSECETPAPLSIRKKAFFVLILAAVVVAVAAPVVILTRTTDDKVAHSAKFLHVKKVIAENHVSSAKALSNSSSSQYRALLWLAYDDQTSEVLKDEERLIQRYVAASLFFSTENTAEHPLNKIMNGHECSWNFNIPTFSWGLLGGISCSESRKVKACFFGE